MKKRFYEKQGFKFSRGFLPIFGHLIELSKIMKKYDSNFNPVYNLRSELTLEEKKFSGIFHGKHATLFISDP
jgi:hypothetical protein